MNNPNSYKFEIARANLFPNGDGARSPNVADLECGPEPEDAVIDIHDSVVEAERATEG